MPGKEVFDRYLHTNGIRRSRQRDQILDVFLHTEGHVTLEEFCGLVRQQYPHIGFATVHRAMKLICDSGVGEGVRFGDKTMRYERRHGCRHHDHLVCMHCGDVIEVSDPVIEKDQIKLAKRHGFEVKSHSLTLYGLCRKCREKCAA